MSRTRSPQRKALGTIAGLTLLLTIGVGASASGVGAESENTAPVTQQSSECVVPHELGLQRTPAPNGLYAFERWIANPAAQQGVWGLGRAVTDEFGKVSKVRTSSQLARGYIGTAVDHTTQSMVVVVDPTRVDTSMLQQRLSGVTSAAAPDGRQVVPVRVHAGCFAADELIGARRVLEDRSWHPDADDTSYAFSLDPYDSRIHVTIPKADQPVAESLRARLGDLVRIEYGKVGPGYGRYNDESPHYGRAQIHDDSGTCTAGFSVVLPSGYDGAVTAGHCYPNGTAVGSGPHYYGTTGGKSGFPTWDMEWVSSKRSDQSYSPWIYTTSDDYDFPEGDNTEVRRVQKAVEPVEGAYLCDSGATTKARCNIHITDLDAELCPDDEDWCIPGLVKGVKPGWDIMVPGDSGGPIYKRISDHRAAVNGILVGWGRHDGIYDTMYGERWDSIRTHLDVSVIKCGC